MGKLLPFRSQAARPKGEHIFVNNVRFWSMFAIIAMHCVTLVPIRGSADPFLSQVLITPLKFGTIAFFLISGFLLGERMHQGSALEYFRRRLQKVLLPWLLWFSAAVALLLLSNLTWDRAAAAAGAGPLTILAHWAHLCLVSSSFWFVPNLFIALALLLLLRRFLYHPGFGILLVAINLFYAANIYTSWIGTRHTEAVLGFVLYLWLGAFAARHQQQLMAVIDLTSLPALLVFTLFSALLSFGEARILTGLGSSDPLNTLRLTNQVFSVLVVLLFLKVRQTLHPSFVNVRNHTFGLYLSHSFLLVLLGRAFGSHFRHHQFPAFLSSTTGRLGLAAFSFFVVYTASFLVVRRLARSPRLQWSVGVPAATPPRPSTPQIIPVWTLEASGEISDATAR